MARKRYRELHAKPGELRAYYGMADGDGPDVCFANGVGVPKGDSHLLHQTLTREFTDELKSRGYDISTLRFSVCRFPSPNPGGQGG